MKRFYVLGILFLLGVLSPVQAQVNNPRNQVVLQAFWWDYWNSNYPNGWANYLTEMAPRLKAMGVDAIWIPPSIKNTGTNSVGYAPFDHYDLGDKFQKNNVKTRLGDKDELLRMMAVMKANGIDVIQDIVLNHVTGAGSASGQGGQDPAALDDGQTNRYKNFRYTCFATPAFNETSANYLARAGRFSKNWQNFYPNNGNPCCTNEINAPYWGPDVSYESNGYGLSSNAIFNPAQYSDYMRTETRNWLIWYKKQMGWDGVRLDAVKHFPTYAAEDFLWNLQYGSLWANGGTDMFAVGEWVGGSNELDSWCAAVQNRAGTFDFGLRGGIYGVVSGGGFFDLGTIPNYQQQNRYRTVPFVNNHDTFRPMLDANGNYTGWNTGSELAAHVEPNDPRLSVAYAIASSVDGAPQFFLEDLFDIGYNSNRFSHLPTDSSAFPERSDIANILWCHQNLHFKDGQYLVRWQAADALVIEREAKAIIAVNDSYTNWQYLNGVQTAWPDGTVLKDYSGANTGTFTVYGGGKMDIAIPPCDGSAVNGRKGYCIWGPDGITTNYDRGSNRITQEWEMANDLGDRHISSLQQGGALPDQNTECRVVGRIFPNAGDSIHVSLYPSDTTLPITLYIVDKNCNSLDSITGSGVLEFDYTPVESAWHTIKIKNATATQNGQKCYVKVNYKAPQVVATGGIKNKCACTVTSTAALEELKSLQFQVVPNPANENITMYLGDESFKSIDWQITDASGRIIAQGKNETLGGSFSWSVSSYQNGLYFLTVTDQHQAGTQSFIVQH